MSVDIIADTLLLYIFLIISITLHEYGHAWMAWKMGDHTAKYAGRVTLNPIAHIDPIGTVLLPLLAIFLSAGGSPLARFIIGWGKPVPVEPAFFRNRKIGEIMVAVSGPAMNIVLAFGATVLAKFFIVIGIISLAKAMVKLASLSLFLCFFNLLPIPPLDGSHVFKRLTKMREETYIALAHWGFILILIVLQLPFIRYILGFLTTETLSIFLKLVNIG